MTALAEVAPGSAAEDLFRRVATRPAPGPLALHVVREPDPTVVGAQRAAARPVDGDGTPPAPTAASRVRTDDASTAPAPTVTPRVRLVPAPPPARRPIATTPAGGPPPTLAERIRVLRADDRSLASDEADEAPSAPPMEDPTLVVRRLAGASVEVIAGRRPVAQLARWLAPGVLDELRARATVTRAAMPPLARAAAVRGVRVCALHEHLVEATAVVDDGRRVRAIALRLETHRGAWRATALEVG